MTVQSPPTRRQFLARAGALGCSLAASPLMTPISLAATPGDHRLVVIILRGGMDGLDLVRPVGDPAFAGLRPTILGDKKGLPLDGFYELHPSAKGLHQLWTQGELSFAHAVSTPYRDKRSHFDGQDILEAGVGKDGRISDGWLNRLVQTMPEAQLRTALAVGREDLLILNGTAQTTGWSPEASLTLSPATQVLLERMHKSDPLFSVSLHEAIDLAKRLDNSQDPDDTDDPQQMMMQSVQAANRRGGIEAIAKFTADMMQEDTRIASFSITGWDTHVSQAGSFAGSVRKLQAAIMTLKSELGDLWGKTTVMAMTEFGRTVRQNGSRGTDHGTGGAVVMAGGALRGETVHGTWPGLDEADLYQRRDLMPTADIRLYAASAMQGLFGLDKSELEQTIFPGLDISDGLPSILL